MDLNFSIPGAPVGKGRPRFFKGHAVTPTKTRNYEALVKHTAQDALNTMVVQPAFEASCEVSIKAYFAIPQSYTKKKRTQIMEGGTRYLRPNKPDIDNIVKAVLDGMNGVIFRDDVQVTGLKCKKLWCPDNEVPRVEVMITWDD